MNEEEKLHKLIHANLSLLEESGHKLKSSEGMFEKHNIVGFETVGYALLMIINPEECKQQIPWPLLDKTLRSVFRKKFSEFIKANKRKYPDSTLSEIRPSDLQFPGGVKFLRFMHNLSTFTVELELKRMLRREDAERLMLCSISTKKKENETNMKVIQEEISLLETQLNDYKCHQKSALTTLRELEDYNSKLQRLDNQAKEKLTTEIALLDFPDELKHFMVDVENLTGLKEWNLSVESKRQELETQCSQLHQHRDLSAQSAQLIRSLHTQKAELATEEFCLDGTNLRIFHSAHSLAGGNFYNSWGQIRLENVLTCAQSLAEGLVAQSVAGLPLLPQAQDLVETLQAQRDQVEKLHSALETMIQSNEEAIVNLRPSVYAAVRDKQCPEYLKDFQQHPTEHFKSPNWQCKTLISPYKRGYGSRLAIFAKSGFVRKTLKTVVVSVKQRRKSGGHSKLSTPAPCTLRNTYLSAATIYKNVPQSTRILRIGLSNKTNQHSFDTFSEQKGARKSLFGKLPVGRKNPVSIRTTSTPANLETKPSVPSFSISSSDNSYMSEPSQQSTFSIESSLAQPTPRTKRRSIDQIIEKYKQLKKHMDQPKEMSIPEKI